MVRVPGNHKQQTDFSPTGTANLKWPTPTEGQTFIFHAILEVASSSADCPCGTSREHWGMSAAGLPYMSSVLVFSRTTNAILIFFVPLLPMKTINQTAHHSMGTVWVYTSWRYLHLLSEQTLAHLDTRLAFFLVYPPPPCLLNLLQISLYLMNKGHITALHLVFSFSHISK